MAVWMIGFTTEMMILEHFLTGRWGSKLHKELDVAFLTSMMSASRTLSIVTSNPAEQHPTWQRIQSLCCRFWAVKTDPSEQNSCHDRIGWHSWLHSTWVWPRVGSYSKRWYIQFWSCPPWAAYRKTTCSVPVQIKRTCPMGAGDEVSWEADWRPRSSATRHRARRANAEDAWSCL